MKLVSAADYCRARCLAGQHANFVAHAALHPTVSPRNAPLSPPIFERITLGNVPAFAAFGPHSPSHEQFGFPPCSRDRLEAGLFWWRRNSVADLRLEVADACPRDRVTADPRAINAPRSARSLPRVRPSARGFFLPLPVAGRAFGWRCKFALSRS
jgi:hypothetical protein